MMLSLTMMEWTMNSKELFYYHRKILVAYSRLYGIFHSLSEDLSYGTMRNLLLSSEQIKNWSNLELIKGPLAIQLVFEEHFLRLRRNELRNRRISMKDCLKRNLV